MTYARTMFGLLAAAGVFAATPATATIHLLNQARTFSFSDSLLIRTADIVSTNNTVDSYDVDGTPLHNTLSFDGFDTSLGSLINVQIVMTSTQQLVTDIAVGSAAGSGGQLEANPFYASRVLLGDELIASHQRSHRGQYSTYLQCTAPSDSLCNNRSTLNETLTFGGGLGGFDRFKDTDVAFSLDDNLRISGNAYRVGNMVVNFGALSNFTWSGDMMLTYVYDDAVAAVPEPASWAMMIVGFGLVGGVARRSPRQGGRVLGTAVL